MRLKVKHGLGDRVIKTERERRERKGGDWTENGNALYAAFKCPHFRTMLPTFRCLNYFIK